MQVSVGDVATLFRVNESTIRLWDRVGRIPPALRTLGGHRRWDAAAVAAVALAAGYEVPSSWCAAPSVAA